MIELRKNIQNKLVKVHDKITNLKLALMRLQNRERLPNKKLLLDKSTSWVKNTGTVVGLTDYVRYEYDMQQVYDARLRVLEHQLRKNKHYQKALQRLINEIDSDNL